MEKSAYTTDLKILMFRTFYFFFGDNLQFAFKILFLEF